MTPKRNTRLLFALLGGAFAWSVQLMVGYALVEVECSTSAFAFQVFGVRGLLVLFVGLSVLLALLAGFAVWVAARECRPRSEFPRDVASSASFMASTGLLLSGLFVLVIVVTALPVFFVSPCGFH